MNIFATFNSRSDALRLNQALNHQGLASTVINTPRRQGLSCGLSVLFDENYKATVHQTIDDLRLRSFNGFHFR